MVHLSDFIGNRQLHESLFVMLYVGPDQALPLLSALGAIVGVVLMWWRRLAVLTRRVLRSFSKKEEPVPTKQTPQS
jgi:hypothetical protein